MNWNWFFQVLWGLIVFGSLLFILYVFTRYIGGKANKALRGKYISVIETVSIGMDKHIHLIKVGDQFVLIASSGKSIEFLTTINLDEYGMEDTEGSINENVFDFKVFFDKYLQNFKVKKPNVPDTNENKVDISSVPESEVFKSNLNRLRTITAKVDINSKKDGDDGLDET